MPALCALLRRVRPTDPTLARASQVYKKNQVPDPSLPPPVKGQRPEFDLAEVQSLLTDAFTGAAERHIEVGDGLDVLIVEKGAEMRWVNLRESRVVLCSCFALVFVMLARLAPLASGSALFAITD
jgi:hypothetical protein